MINKIVLVGHLGQEPEQKTLDGGQTVTRFSVATNRNWVDKSGNKQSNTEWHRVVVWNKLAEICAKYLNKGKLVYVEGRIQTRQWEDNQGEKKYTTEIIGSEVKFLSGNDGTTSASSSSTQNNAPVDEPDFNSSEEIPF